MRSTPRHFVSFVCLAVSLTGNSIVHAQPEDDEFRAGLLGTYSTAAGARFDQVDDRIAFSWGTAAPDERLGSSSFQVDLRGYLMSQAPGEYRIFAQVAGKLQLKLAGQVIVNSDSNELQWIASAPLKLPFDFHPLEVHYRSLGQQSRLALFWSGPQFQLEPIGIKHFYHDPAETPDNLFRQGASLARALRCAACHELPGDPAAIPGPSLEYLAGNVERSWLVEWLAPKELAPQAAAERRMPHFGIGRAEAVAIADYLLAQSHVTDWKPPAPALRKAPGQRKKKEKTQAIDPLQAGQQLFLSVGCLACHRLGQQGASGLFGGGDLTSIAAKRPAEFYERWLAAPERINQHRRMPLFELSPRERSFLAAFLATQGKLSPSDQQINQEEAARRRSGVPGERSSSSDRQINQERVSLGKQLVVRHRCNACHRLADETLARSTPKRPLKNVDDATADCLETGRGDALRPEYRLVDTDRKALRRYWARIADIKDLAAQSISGPQIVRERNCLACHARDQSLGLAAQLTSLAAEYEQLAPLVPAMTPPSLNSVGDKLHRAALVEAIQRKGTPLRDYLRVRMPKFSLAASEVNVIVDHFIHEDRIPEPGIERVGTETSADGITLRSVGSRLVTADGFGCTSCHQVGAVKPSKAPLNARGPALSLVGNRIRRPWFDRLLRNPPRIIPRMEMPSVRLAVRGVLGDDLQQQLSAVWDVLNEPNFEPPEPDPVRVLRRSGVAEQRQRAVVVTDVVRVHDRQFVKPLLIGLPNRHNLLFDLETSSLTRWSIGDTARQRTAGKTWFWEAAGNEIVQTGLNRPELTIQVDGHWLPAEQQGQFPTEFDAIFHVAGGLGFDQRLRFQKPDGTAVTLVIKQEFTAAGPKPNSGASGIRRKVEIEGATAGSTIRLQLIDSSLMTNVRLQQRTLRLAGSQSHIELKRPTTAVFDEAGGIDVQVGEQGATTHFELVYQTELPVDRFPVVALKPDPVEPIRLEIVPGFETIRLPLAEELMPTAFAWHPGGDLFITSLKGRVWRAQDTNGDEFEDTLAPFSDELAAPYGIAAYDEHVDVIGKYALLRLYDDDRDGQADRTVAIASGWGHTADYHDWVVGLPRDEAGHYYVAIPCQQDDRSPAAARLRGTVVKLVPRQPTPENPRLFDIQQISGGHRFPMGMARSRNGDVFVTDNQGNYNPFNELNHVQPGVRFGFINKLERRPGFSPSLTPPAIDIPHPWTRSVNGICFLDTPRPVQRALGRTVFGPFEGHLVGCEYDTRRLVRMTLEKIDDDYQGAVYPFSYDEPAEGPPFLGPLVCAVAPDGDLYIGGIRDSGWGGANNVGEIVKMRMRRKRLPCGIAEVRATSSGFTIDFTTAVDPELAARHENYSVSSYTRFSTPAYGGDDQRRRNDPVTEARVSSDARRVTLKLTELRRGYAYEIHLKNVAGVNQPFYPAEAYYTMRNIPE